MSSGRTNRAIIIDLWCGNDNVYVLQNILHNHGFIQNNLLLPGVQRGNSCGYIAACAALEAHFAENWFTHDYLPAITDVQLVPHYNSLLNINSQEASFLTDDQILFILQASSGSSTGVPWINLQPFNYFTDSLARHVASERYHNRTFISIVNTTSVTGPFTEHAVGDHWITVIYECC